ncbi:MAG: formylglycine-generating enzyme family protein, partial [Candidatus Devosia euplotis]|nr:formylglycine-generating enzyme family protein [Candidatus Devosia euplotis]
GAAHEVIALRGGKSHVGASTPVLPLDGEGPESVVRLPDYGLEATIATNVRFAQFVAATDYVTEAELFGWSAVFFNTPERLRSARLAGATLPWWHRVEGVCWNQPEGSGSATADRLDYPVVQVSWADAAAFATWVGGRLPSETEWEYAARGGSHRQRFPWGDAEPTDDTIFCNIWQGRFPQHNLETDDFLRAAPARSFAPSALGFYNMADNVWEWTRDPYRIRSNSRPAKARNDQALAHADKVLKGGSFLCHVSYCYRYRITALMALSPDSATNNTGFRIAYDGGSR